MKEENLIYWLQGAFEFAGLCNFTDDDIEILKDHVNLVLKHDPNSKFANWTLGLLETKDKTKIHEALRRRVSSELEKLTPERKKGLPQVHPFRVPDDGRFC